MATSSSRRFCEPVMTEKKKATKKTKKVAKKATKKKATAPMADEDTPESAPTPVTSAIDAGVALAEATAWVEGKTAAAIGNALKAAVELVNTQMSDGTKVAAIVTGDPVADRAIADAANVAAIAHKHKINVDGVLDALATVAKIATIFI